MIKRLMDIFVSLIALTVLAIPFLIVIVTLRLTGEGKVFYLQDRVGYKGKHFKVYKFITMRENSENMGSGTITVRNDPRVLPVGRILRKTKINELPQIINVLKGDMSLVGWRPLVPKGFNDYPQHIKDNIIDVKPGLTGIGSIIFRDEEAIVTEAGLQGKDLFQCYREDILPHKGALELWYRDHQSFWLDIKIIFATAYVVLFSNSTAYFKWFKGLPEPQSPLVRKQMGLAVAGQQQIQQT